MQQFRMQFMIIGILCIAYTAQPLFAQYETSLPADKLNYTAPNPYETVVVQPVHGHRAKNVVLMIGDGMGLTQSSVAWVANRGRLNLDQFTHTGIARTYAANRLITDSGAAGTAMATGEKTNYHAVGVDVQGNRLPSLVDLAHAHGLSTAIVVTCGLTDATPAAFCAGNADRDNELDLALDFLDCPADYILGGGRRYFTGRDDGRDILEEMKGRGFHVTSDWAGTRDLTEGKIFAVLEHGQLPLAPQRGDVWRQAVMHAIGMVSQNKHGFFAMFEGSRIDDAGHWHDIPALVQEIFDFDQAVGEVLKWAARDGETLVIVLADHETGGLTLLDGDIGTGYVQGHFSTGGHSGILVPVYAWGPQAEQFTGVYENVEIFSKIADILKLMH